MWQRGRCVLRHASSCCRACSSSWGNDDELLGFINRSSLPSSGRPIDSSRTAYIKLSSLAANSRTLTVAESGARRNRTRNNIKHNVGRIHTYLEVLVLIDLCSVDCDKGSRLAGEVHDVERRAQCGGEVVDQI